MGNFTYENQAGYTYLVYEVEANEQLDSLSLGMITNNKIMGIAPALYTQMDDRKLVKYNISGKISMEQFFSGIVRREFVLKVLSGISSALLTADDYMIQINEILLDKQYIYIDACTSEVSMICVPVANSESANVNVYDFFKQLMFTTQFDQGENCAYIGQILNFLNQATTFTLMHFKQMLDDMMVNSAAGFGGAQQMNQQVPPQMNRQVPLQMNRQVPPQMNQQVPPQMNQQVPPQMNQQVPPQMNQQVPPQMNQQVPPQMNQQVPPQMNRQVPPQMNQQGAKGEKGISWMYLMQHYNKENAALYKEQKERKKEEKKMQKGSKGKKGKQEPNPGVAYKVPGAPAMNIPGQPQVPPQMNQQVPPQMNQQVPPQMNPQVPPMQNKQMNIPGQAPVQPVQQMPVQPIIPQQPMQQQPANFGETTVLNMPGAAGDTTVLNAGMQQTGPQPYLIRMKTNEKILIDKPVFRIGKERSYVDYFVTDNTAISRSHANIITREGAYYIMDTNSTNHTYVNEQMVQPNAEIRLENNVVIRLANENFEFRIF